MSQVLAYQGNREAVIATHLLIIQSYRTKLEEKLISSHEHSYVWSGELNYKMGYILEASLFRQLIDPKWPSNIDKFWNSQDFEEDAKFDFTVLQLSESQLYHRRFRKGENIIKVPSFTFYAFGILDVWKTYQDQTENNL